MYDKELKKLDREPKIAACVALVLLFIWIGFAILKIAGVL